MYISYANSQNDHVFHIDHNFAVRAAMMAYGHSLEPPESQLSADSLLAHIRFVWTLYDRVFDGIPNFDVMLIYDFISSRSRSLLVVRSWHDTRLKADDLLYLVVLLDHHILNPYSLHIVLFECL